MVVQAIHWFDVPGVWRDVARVLKNDGIFAFGAATGRKFPQR